MRQQLGHVDDVFHDKVVYFEDPPSKESKLVRTSKMNEKSIDELCSLDVSAPSNSSIVGYQGLLSRTWEHAQTYVSHPSLSVQLQAKLNARTVEEEEGLFRSMLLREWRRQRSAAQETNFLNTSRYFNRTLRCLPLSILAIYLLVGTLHLLSGLSLDDCSFLLRSLRLVLGILLATSTSIHASSVATAMHIDMRTVLRSLDVHPEYNAYLVCPRCSKTHKFNPEAPPSEHPQTCDKEELGVRCGGRLLKSRNVAGGSTTSVPIREYRHQPFNSYLARLFARPDLRDHLDRDPTKREKGEQEGEWDIWDATCLREFKGPDGKPFVKAKGESRLIFSLNMDGFNPYGNREAGKKVSMENIYLVGVIPGPQGPTDHEINYFLAPLVDDMLILWEKGVFLSQTARCPHGRRVRVAVGPLVCDLPAARQMSGFAHYRSRRFCSECNLTVDRINDITPTWNPRTWKGHVSAAKDWKDAKTQEERDRIVHTHGVRWSELVCLPYWDPTRFTVIDSMHAFYLRLFQHHCRSVWGMDVTLEDGDGPTFDRGAKEIPEEQIRYGEHVLQHGHEDILSGLSRSVLRELCRQAQIPFRRNKGELVDQLKAYRVQQHWFTSEGVHIGGQENEEVLNAPVAVTLEHNSDVLPNAKAVENFWLTASKTKLKELNKSDLLILFRSKALPSLNISEAEVVALTNSQLKSSLEEKRIEEGICGPDGRLLATATLKKTWILGRQTLAEVRRDMARLHLPSWVARPPSRPGEKKWGKFTADQWRTFCMQTLPVALIRLWGGQPEGSKERRRLDNFMHLVSAVKLATMHQMTEQRITEYEYHIRQYLQTLISLYPGTSITPYQHLSLHFGRHLRLFGPVHAWRCFPFERFNYILQQFPTNERFGEIEKTMFSKFCCMQNLKALYSCDELPEKLHELIEFYHKNYESDLRGSRLSDVFADDNRFGVVEDSRVWDHSDFTMLSDEDFELLRDWMTTYQPDDRSYSRQVVRRPEIHRFGQRFTDRNRSLDDSHILFRQGDDDVQVGSILGIFSQAQPGGVSEQTWAVIQPYEALAPEDTHFDNYRSYSVLGSCLFRNRWDGTPILVDVRSILCHFASCVLEVEGIAGECRLVLPLNKVHGRLSNS